jgi:hypothetical protein
LPDSVGPYFGGLPARDALSGLTEASENVPLRKADHRLLRDLVHFERLTPAQRQRGKDGDRRDEFSHCCPREFAARSLRPKLPQARRFDNAGLDQIAVAALA